METIRVFEPRHERSAWCIAASVVAALAFEVSAAAAEPAIDFWIEAESYEAQHGSSAPFYAMPGASGNRIVDNGWGGRAGHFLRYEFDLPRPVAKLHIVLAYARAFPDAAEIEVRVDGETRPVQVPSTGGWGFEKRQWRWLPLEFPSRAAGQHTLEIRSRSDGSNVNFDRFRIRSSPVPKDLLAKHLPDQPIGEVERLAEEVDALARAMVFLAARYPSYDRDGALRRQLSALRESTSRTESNSDHEHSAAELVALKRRALLSENPVLRFDRLLFVRRHSLGWGGGHYAYNETLSWFRDQANGHRVFRPGSSLCALSLSPEGGTVDVLVDCPTGVIRDPNVHFDGERALFAQKKSLDHDDYHLYEIDVASRDVRALTSDEGFADYEGCYLPDDSVIFNSTRCVQTVDCFPTPVSNLYRMDRDGSNVHRLTVNHVHDNFPTVLNDGRVIFTRWEYNDRWVIHVQGLAAMNPDGTGGTAFYGNNSFWPISMLHARAIPGSHRIVCTLSGHHDVDQSGEIGIFDTSLGSEEASGCVHIWPPRKIEPIRDEMYWRRLPAVYQYPYPLSEQFFLVSCKPRGKKHFGIYLIDTFGNRVRIHEEDSISCLSPMPLAPRPRPPVLPSRVDFSETTGTVCLIDVYRGSAMAGVERGEVKALRVVELVHRPAGTKQWAGMDGTPPMGLNSSWDAKRVVGTVPVDDSGSAVFRVPAGKSVYFQPLDETGKAIQSERSWVTVQPGEVRSCVGCHDRKREAPLSSVPEALARTPLVPDPGWCATDRPFNFHEDVQPVLDRACARCHDQDGPEGIDLRADKTDAFSLGYENLRLFVKVAGTRSDPPKIPPRSVGAVASPLIRLLEEGHEDVELSAEEMDRLIVWIDLGAPYYGTYAITRYEAPFGRCIVEDASPLWRALGETCTPCHKASTPPGVPEGAFGRTRDGRGFAWRVGQNYDTTNAVLVNLTHPEQSRLLRAPLATSAGGLGLCGSSSFSTTADPRYRAALDVLRGWSRELAANPREDMPGATPCAEYLVWWQKRLESDAIERRSRRALAESQRR